MNTNSYLNTKIKIFHCNDCHNMENIINDNFLYYRKYIKDIKNNDRIFDEKQLIPTKLIKFSISRKELLSLITLIYILPISFSIIFSSILYFVFKTDLSAIFGSIDGYFISFFLLRSIKNNFYRYTKK